MGEVAYINPFRQLTDEQLHNELEVAYTDYRVYLISTEIERRIYQEGSTYWVPHDE